MGTQNLKARTVAIVLYIAPIIVTTLLTRSMKGFLFSTGAITVVLGIVFRVAPAVLGHAKSKETDLTSFVIVASGVFSLILGLFNH